MYTSSKRVAAAVLNTDVTFEPELRALLPEGVPVYANRVAYPPEVTATNLARAVADLERCVTALAAVRPHVIVWACTSGSVLGGPDDHERLLERLTAWSGGAAPVTAASAVIGALQRREVRRVGVATPYPPEVRDLLLKRLHDADLEVVAAVDAFEDRVDDWTLQALPPEAIADLARRANRPSADAVLVSCTGLAGSGITVESSLALGKPVMTSNVAIAEAVALALEGLERA